MKRSLVRSGLGYDSHRFEQGGPIVLGGVAIPSSQRLAGHSDADALCHAITDALLGAAAAGDIGDAYPDSDPANAGRDSLEMLRSTMQALRSAGWELANVDATVIAEHPRIGPYRDEMRRRLAAALGIDLAQVGVKGKSNEGMGSIGRGEGIACFAVATIERAEP